MYRETGKKDCGVIGCEEKDAGPFPWLLIVKLKVPFQFGFGQRHLLQVLPPIRNLTKIA
jgi:hypothetical protein